MRINTWGPAHAIFGSPYEAANLQVDLMRLGRMCRGELEVLPRTITNATHHDLANLIRSGAPLACDIETAAGAGLGSWTGKDPTLCRLKSIGFGTCDVGVSLMWDEADEVTKDMVSEMLSDPAILKVFHNGVYFDIRVLNRYGMTVNHFEDTRDMRRALVSTSKLSLAYLGSLYTDFPAWKLVTGAAEEKVAVVDEEEEVEDAHDEQAEELAGKAWASSNTEELMRYNALDCVVTARVYRGLLREAAWRDE